MDDAQLLQVWASGDRSAGEELFERHFDAIHRFFLSMVSDGAEDLVQRTFTAAIERRDTIRNGASFRAFLYGVARYELLQELRRRYRGRERVIDLSVSTMEGLDPSPSQLAIQDQERRQLLTALRRIPIDLQIVVQLHYWEELTTGEIAEVIDVPPGTVKSRLRRAREQLAKHLGDDDGFL